MSSPLVHEKVWADKYKYEEAEKQYFERLAKLLSNNGISYPPKPTLLTNSNSTSSVVNKTPEYSPLPSPSTTSVNAPMDAEQDKKKKRRKRNNANNGLVLSSNVSTNNTVIQEVVLVEAGTDKKVKEKKNEASRKGKKQSPEPKGTPANPPPPSADDKSSLASEVARARQHIKSSLECVDRISSFSSNTANGADVINRILCLEKENETLRKLVEIMQKSQDTFENRLIQLEKKCSSVTGPSKAPAQAKPAAKKDDDDDVDLFGSGSEDEDEAATKLKEQRVAEYAAKKSKKPALIAKSNVILDVKPWDDETDMKQLEQAVRSIKMDGLLWGASKLVPLAYGIQKLQISSVVEDDKVSIDLLTETIEENEDFVQSVDIAAFNKI